MKKLKYPHNYQWKFGWKPDLPDIRDYMYFQKDVKIPSSIDLRDKQSQIYNQGRLGSCTANAIASVINYEHYKEFNTFINPSRLFIYYNERKLGGNINEDSGAYIRDGIKTVNKDGVCSEKLWSYNIARFKIKPPKICYKEALKEQTIEYRRLCDINEYKNCLAFGNTFVFGFSVYDSFMTQEMANTGIMKMPTSHERVHGGHAVCAVGYDNIKERILVLNSWSIDWGLKGYFWMPYEYINNSHLCSDFWTITKVE